ncbi:MAG TPA: hypothetical protein PKD78_00835, partial [Saprospiraceae bacterium]|nr:hypothetical protein [Saprospiraceae bacterium]
MMHRVFIFPAALLLLLSVLLSGAWKPLPQGAPQPPSPPWGFFAHKRINRLAVLTLPPGMMVLFKPNIDWITEHAVDPDMRRYATRHEGPRHFIDLDRYGSPPFSDLPRGKLDKEMIDLAS